MQKIALFSICAVLAAFLGDYIGHRHTKAHDDALDNYNKGAEERVAKAVAIREKETQAEIKKIDAIVANVQANIEETKINYQRFIEAKEPLKAAEVYWKWIRVSANPILKPNECIVLAYRDVEKRFNPHLSLDDCFERALLAIVRDREKVEESMKRLQK